MNCKNTRSCCSPYSELAQQLEETTERAIQAYNLAVQGLRNPVNENLTINADLIVNGDIFQYGAAYETHAEKVYTNDDYIVMRDGAVSALAEGDYSGFQVTKYDGVNDGRLVIDKDGTARVGDVSDEQPLATRDESADLTDGHLVKWDGTDLKLTDAGVSPDEIGGLELVDVTSSNVYVPSIENMDGIFTLSTGPFEAGYDYFLFIYVAGGENANIRGRYDTQTVGYSNVDLKIQTKNSVTFNTRLYRSATNNPLQIGVRLNTIGSARTNDQEILVSGVNIKTVGGQSILGSGDIAVGGMTFTRRSPTNDWSDLFEVNGITVKAKKNILMVVNYTYVFLPKGYYDQSQGTLYIEFPAHYTILNFTATYGRIELPYNKVVSGNALTTKYYGVEFTTDGSVVTLTNSVESSTKPKSDLIIWTAD